MPKSQPPSTQARSLALGIPNITNSVHIKRLSEHEYQEAGIGGSADIFRGTYLQKGGQPVDVAIKCIRVGEFDGRDPEHENKMRKKLAREIEIWHTLSGGTNIIKLLGIFVGIGPLPALVCTLCTWNLDSYLKKITPPPKHIQMMTDALRGLTYMHELKPNPIIHGDIKSHNILVTADERALICDFGRSRLPFDQPRDETESTPFYATIRYMSPELFVPPVLGPTAASDMWAYGCVALEILCRIAPYQEIPNEYEVVEHIKQGRAPSERPRGARAALVNDPLWSTVASCWREKGWRPTSRMFLDQLSQMLRSGQVSISPLPVDLFPLAIDGPLISWPEDIRDLRDSLVIDKSQGVLASSIRSHIWRGNLTGRLTSRSNFVAVKVPRLNVDAQSRESHDHLQHLIRKTLRVRYGVNHQNIVEVLGIDSRFSPHPGIVLEYCASRDLADYFKANSIDMDATARPSVPLVNAYSLICDILQGLEYMHNYPVPIPQGNLTPDNVLITTNGLAKIQLFSLGRIIAAIPTATTLSTSVGPILPFRWMSPELLLDNMLPTPQSDIWSMGCVGFWILTGLQPYAGHLRDDFAGVESVRGIAPGDITLIDHATKFGGRHWVRRESTWITNGTWRTISQCWTFDPLLRPKASEFLSIMEGLKGQNENWIPKNVIDLAGKVKQADPHNDQVGGRILAQRWKTIWMEHSSGSTRPKEHTVDMTLLRATYTPKWYSRPVTVVVKQESDNEIMLMEHDFIAYIASIRHEVAIMAQLNHPNIHKMLGIDSDHEHFPGIIFEYCSETTLYKLLKTRETSFDENIQIITEITSAIEYIHEHPNGTIVHANLNTRNVCMTHDGHAKLMNFTCAFQYTTEAQAIAPISSIVSAVWTKTRWQSPEYHLSRTGDNIPLPTASSDIWSLGCVILNVFVRSHPFFSIPMDEVTSQITRGLSPCQAEECAGLNSGVLALIRVMLYRDPKLRPTAKEVLNYIAELE